MEIKSYIHYAFSFNRHWLKTLPQLPHEVTAPSGSLSPFMSSEKVPCWTVPLFVYCSRRDKSKTQQWESLFLGTFHHILWLLNLYRWPECSARPLTLTKVHNSISLPASKRPQLSFGPNRNTSSNCDSQTLFCLGRDCHVPLPTCCHPAAK